MHTKHINTRWKALLFLALLASLVCAPTFSTAASLVNDRVVIQKRKITIVRSGKFLRDFPERRRAVINLPVISGLQPLALLKKVRAHLELKNIFDTSLAEYRQDTWLSEFDYTVNYNKNYILDITFMQDGVGAYPDTHFKHFVINLKTGDILKAKDVFKEESLAKLTAMVNEKLQAESKKIIREAEARGDVTAEEKEGFRGMLNNLQFETSNLDEFQVGDRGVTFLYDAGFPHVIKAFQPEGQYFFSYSELAAHIKTGGLLANLAR